jgi:tripartite-type tricarboxylate transporter receptor subunit TctC
MMRVIEKFKLFAVAAFVAASAGAQAQGSTAAYPSKTVTLVVPYAAGGVADATARLLAQKLQESWNHSVVVEKKVGAGGLIGAGAVARAPADGHTLLQGVSGLVLQPQMMEKAPYDPFKDFTPITLIARLPLLLAVPSAGQGKSMEDFIARAKAAPAAVSIGNYGIGTPSHLLSIMLNQQAKLDLSLVPYQGSSQLATNLLGGQISAGLIDSVTARQFSDRLHFLAVTGEKRLAGLPNLPTFRELGYRSFEQDGWLGVLVPAATPRPVVDKLAADIARIIASPEVSAKINSMGITPVGSSPAEFSKVMRTDFDVYGKVIKESNIRLK